MKGKVYLIRNKINNKIYIGKTIRENNSFNNYWGSGLKIINAIKKYDKDNFEKKILKDDINDTKKLNELEIYLIEKYNSTDRYIGYNISKGGDGGYLGEGAIKKAQKTKKKKGKFRHTEETKMLIRQSSLNRKHTEETKKKLSDIKKGIKFSDEHIKNLSKSHKGYKPSKETLKKLKLAKKGTMPSRKTIEAAILVNKGSKRTQNQRINISKGINNKSILQYDLDSNLIKEWGAMFLINDYYGNGKRITGISACCNGRQKSSMGYIWKYKE